MNVQDIAQYIKKEVGRASWAKQLCKEVSVNVHGSLIPGRVPHGIVSLGGILAALLHTVCLFSRSCAYPFRSPL